MGRSGILIVEDKKEIIRKFTKILSSIDDVEILGTALSGYEGVLKATLLQPDIILMDYNIEYPTSGIYASKVLLQHFPNIKIIILFDEEKSDLIQTASKIGVVDYILKETAPGDIIKTIKEVNSFANSRHLTVMDRYYRRNLHQEGTHDSLMYTLTKVSQLTPRELEILKMISEGKDYNHISKLRNVDLQTIENDINNILGKFNKKSVDELIKVIKRLNIIELLDNII